MNYKIEIALNPDETKGYVLIKFLEALKMEAIFFEVKEDGKEEKIEQKTICTTDRIKKIVCKHLNVDESLLSEDGKKGDAVEARQISHYFARKYTYLSCAKIGAAIGGKDHATVLHSIKTVNNLADTEKMYKERLELIDKELKKNL
jgi:chromosomal replication initiator protein